MNAAIQAPGTESAVDARNPWLGLASFTEETREFFHGREGEVAELARRVQRKLLTVLFGQSGLGKTSILRAGLVPRLRGQGYCPVYVRIDYAPAAPEPAEQIKQSIARTARHSGQWTQSGVAVQGESLWEFLHHRDDVLRDETGSTLIPLLIFDQFEEIFTLAQSDDFGRARAARFIADLADLVENRPPRELEERLDRDDSAADHFDFARSDYRVLIALREDYLAPLEGLKGAMPSITQNRLRLAPMTGTQALAAVTLPGKRLVTEEVAAAIVRFVAGNAEIANAEVEPSLLSLICRELNDTRIAQGRSEISLDLLAGSHASILSNFYERSLADQPATVRRLIEDELLTDSGFRENVAEEKLLGSLRAAGAEPTALATLVNRRLLRIEERLDVRRVELTHDVLCGVVKASRDVRKEREARDASERLLAEQRMREMVARKALVRARQIAGFCIVLAIGAVAAAGLAYFSTQRARRAEAQAQETRQLTEKARGQAEQLLGYLTEDFSHELEAVGRQDILLELAKRQVDYFNALPASLKLPDTQRNGAMAMVQYAGAARRLGRNGEAGKAADQAIGLLENLRKNGDATQRTLIALAKSYDVKASVLGERESPDTLAAAQRAVDLVKPVAESPGADFIVRRAYVEALTGITYQYQKIGKLAESHETAKLAMQVAARSGALDLSQIDMSVLFAYAGAWDVQGLYSLGRAVEAEQVGATSSDLVHRVLQKRPTYLLALKSQQLLGTNLGFGTLDSLDPATALKHFQDGVSSSKNLSLLDPDNTVIQFNYAISKVSVAESMWQTGRLHESIDAMMEARTIFDGARHEAFVSSEAIARRANFYLRAVDLGDDRILAGQSVQLQGDLDFLRRTKPAGSMLVPLSGCIVDFARADAERLLGHLEASLTLAKTCAARVKALTAQTPLETYARSITLFYGLRTLGETQYAAHDYAGAEQSLRQSLVTRDSFPIGANSEYRDRAEVSTYLAMSLAMQKKLDEAKSIIDPVMTLHRRYQAMNKGDQFQYQELAAALYAKSLCDPASRASSLREAAALIERLPQQMRGLRSVRVWRERIAGVTT